MAGDAAPSQLMLVGVAVAAVWAVLLGACYLGRAILGLRRSASLLLLIGIYVVLVALALLVIGANGRGLLGAAGMLVPLAVASALAVLRRSYR